MLRSTLSMTMLGAVLLLAGCGSAPAASPAASAPSSPSAPASAAAPAKPAASAPASAAAASASASAAAKPAASGVTKLNVGLGQAVAQVSPVWIAQDAGIFAKSNLEVDSRVAAATTGMAALLSGDLNFHIGGGSEMLNGVANGADLVAIANLAPKSALRFEVAPSIKTDKDLVGKKLGITRIGSATHSASRTLLQKIGLDPDKDVTFVQLDTTANVTAAMLSGNIQAALCTPPECLKVEAAGYRPMYDLAQLNMPDTTAVVIAQRPYVNANKTTTQSFIDGLIAGIAREKKDKPFAVASLKKNMKIDSDADASATYDHYIDDGILASQPFSRPEQFADVVSVITAQTGKLKDFDVNKVIDNSFVQSAIDRGLDK